MIVCVKSTIQKDLQRLFLDIQEDMPKALTKPQNGYGEIYWVDAKVIEELKKKYVERNISDLVV